MKINLQFTAGIFFTTSLFSWIKLIYWHFDKGIIFYLPLAVIAMVISIMLIITSNVYES